MMLRGKVGLAGGGIYFAENANDTHHKAHSLGVIFKVPVELGKVKKDRSYGGF